MQPREVIVEFSNDGSEKVRKAVDPDSPVVKPVKVTPPAVYPVPDDSPLVE
jgi:hypothetical protein